jgi:hypothetical protein
MAVLAVHEVIVVAVSDALVAAAGEVDMHVRLVGRMVALGDGTGIATMSVRG